MRGVFFGIALLLLAVGAGLWSQRGEPDPPAPTPVQEPPPTAPPLAEQAPAAVEPPAPKPAAPDAAPPAAAEEEIELAQREPFSEAPVQPEAADGEGEGAEAERGLAQHVDPERSALLIRRMLSIYQAVRD